VKSLINAWDWKAMTGQEKEALVFTTLGVDPHQFDQIIQEFAAETGKKPNAIFISWRTLTKIPARIKKLHRMGVNIQVIPMEADEGKFVLSLQDPHQWGDLFYS
jgi:hypothetical protein